MTNKVVVAEDIEELFMKGDINGDGKLCSKDLLKIFRILGMEVSKEDTKKMIKQFRTNKHSAQLQKEDFQNLVEFILDSQPCYKEAWEAFNAIDTNRDSLISKKELYSALSRFNRQMTKSEFQELFDYLDADGDGCLNFDEFARHYIDGLKVVFKEKR